MSKHDKLSIFIRECRVQLPVGIYAQEMKAAQPVLVTVELQTSRLSHYDDKKERALDRVMDYERVYNFLQNDLPKLGHIYLLESIADAVIDFCFQDHLVENARVRLEKTDIFPAAAGAGVEIMRYRKMEKGI